MDVARTGNFPCARFSFFCIIFRIVFFLYLVNLVITLLGCHLSVPLSSSRQPVGGDRLRRLLTTCMMYLIHTYRPYRMYELFGRARVGFRHLSLGTQVLYLSVIRRFC